MATMVVVCSGLGWKKLTYLLTATVYLAHPRTHMVPWRICYKYKQVTSNKNLPIPMENPYKEPLKKYILCGKYVNYKNVPLLVFVGRNRKKSQKQLREPK
ncbi:small ribosomal subunit protein bS18m-like isoform X2 [Saimiri boliviensis]|uniref:small ribosomal subunit protein bS18m-like isoform X2 n=1 Tax=Saimiri boliviensis TaxID=27679 RepID=UPI00193DF1C9|nr:28S ribosomal protein S18c, mitochondrial-like isoform X2 [Saimiri boliviensis boliviensis]